MSEVPYEPLTDEERQTASTVLDKLTDHPFLFSTITGTHQYGFTSPDSDIDVRGAFVIRGTDPDELSKQSNHAGYMGIIDEREADGVAFEADHGLPCSIHVRSHAVWSI